MTQPLDRKVIGVLHKTKNGEYISPDEYVVFLAKDNAFPPTLAFYIEECKRIGADERQIASAVDLLERVNKWRLAHKDRLKVPDVEPGEL